MEVLCVDNFVKSNPCTFPLTGYHATRDRSACQSCFMVVVLAEHNMTEKHQLRFLIEID